MAGKTRPKSPTFLILGSGVKWTRPKHRVSWWITAPRQGFTDLARRLAPDMAPKPAVIPERHGDTLD